jgi:hypothetical protein
MKKLNTELEGKIMTAKGQMEAIIKSGEPKDEFMSNMGG